MFSHGKTVKSGLEHIIITQHNEGIEETILLDSDMTIELHDISHFMSLY